MTTGTSIRAAAVAVLAVAAWAASTAGAVSDVAKCEPQLQVPASDGDLEWRAITLGKGKSIVCDFPRDIKNVLVAEPKTANVVMLSSRRAYIIGNESGATNIIFFDTQDKQMVRFDIAVSRDVNVIQRAIRKLIQGADVTVEAIGDGIILTGTVASQVDSQMAFNIAAHYVNPGDAYGGIGGGGGGGGAGGSSNSSSSSVSLSSVLPSLGAGSTKIVNNIIVRGRDQVMLKVTVAEMDRTVLKQLGVNLNGSVSLGTSVVNFNNANSFPINGALSTANSFNQYGMTAPNIPSGALGQQLPNSPAGFTGSYKSLTANLQAMEQVGVVRTLAEPTLTAVSGESAHFLAGGSFPEPALSCNGTTCTPTINQQPYGVGLNFTPVVLSEGRISLHVATEVSEINNQNSVTLSGITVPGLTVRRADTTAEISSGGTLVMAGMIQEQTRQTISGLPGLMEVPVLGALFKSTDYLNNQTELVVLVTPYIVRAVAQKDLSRPDDGFADASDPASVLLGRLNRIYGVGGIPDPPDNYRGKYGFILD